MFSLTTRFASDSIFKLFSGSGGPGTECPRAFRRMSSMGVETGGGLYVSEASGIRRSGGEVEGEARKEASSVTWVGVRSRIFWRSWICSRAQSRWAVLFPTP